ncbi:hypothetical protein EKN35_21625 [Enterobacter asburiae]|nr:hypothetical protein C2U41_24825 [Citrobacter freundii complex sp. CFNIH4]POU13570.1 hypothetical protein C3368_06985 [Citrobacter freundii complex sp. CFNIH7]POU17365.1 hypothetical protein C3381_04840 [Citrobacter freundii complex sp. CFNIH6]RTP86005.1 hypothetical protein EKN35_21625 [Enterobacter asburiae]TYY87789.1 hypothetical protein FCH07_025095 [Klebsiella pneumoniae]
MAKCSCCGKVLNRGIWTADGKHKSCPLCSATHGVQHVFRRYPEDFGTTDARVTASNPDGAQSYCIDCRGVDTGQPSPVDLTKQRLCNTVKT